MSRPTALPGFDPMLRRLDFGVYISVNLEKVQQICAC
jgi:hypothetical protein